MLDDKNAAFTFSEIGRSTAGVTLGTGEGGNAFGDRFFIRGGFDVRNDIFVDGIRDPGVSIRENFYTEQVEILRGPGSTFAGRGTCRRRDQHRHQTSDRSRLHQSYRDRRLLRPHAADNARRQQGDQSDPRGARQRALP
ncbi:MAG: TonB-dependent receptor plug domain-containing protein [Methylocystis sp.]